VHIRRDGEKMLKTNKWGWFFLALSVAISMSSASERLNYQGKLAHGNSPVTATVPMVFQIYDGQSGTNLLYEESMDVDVVDGYYSVELGENPNLGQLLSAIKREDAHIQVVVDGKELKPREKVGKPPFANNSPETWRAFSYRDQINVAEINSGSKSLFDGDSIKYGISMELYQYAAPNSDALIVFPPSVETKTVESVRYHEINRMGDGPYDNPPSFTVKVFPLSA
jgi:hypothetical protein